MKNSLHNKAISTFIVAFVVVSTVGLSVGASPAAPAPPNITAQTTVSMPGPQVVLLYDENQIPHHVPPPPQVRLGIQAQTAIFAFNWNPASCSGTVGTWPSDAKTAFQYAANIWASLLNSSQTIVVGACWRTDLHPLVLGSAGTTTVHRSSPSFTTAPIANTWYPAALASALQNSDLNGSTAEILANFNAGRSDWYYGTDGNTPGSEIDFASVVLHELGHGLGFFGFGDVDTGDNACGTGNPGDGCLGYLGYPSAYDRFTEDGSDTLLLSYTNPSATLGNALTGKVGGGVYFDGPSANAANTDNGKSPVKLYAPSTWASGSSYSHLDEIFNGTDNALMTYSLGPGTSEHSPGPVMLGMFKDMGWMIGDADLRITKRVVGGGLDLAPGDPVTFTLSIENIGGATATGVIVTDTLSTDILTPTFETSLASITATGVISYVWELPDLAANVSEVITIYGTISHTMPITGFAIWNTASISTDDIEEDTNNNSSMALVGGYRVYLPLLLNNYE